MIDTPSGFVPGPGARRESATPPIIDLHTHIFSVLHILLEAYLLSRTSEHRSGADYGRTDGNGRSNSSRSECSMSRLTFGALLSSPRIISRDSGSRTRRSWRASVRVTNWWRSISLATAMVSICSFRLRLGVLARVALLADSLRSGWCLPRALECAGSNGRRPDLTNCTFEFNGSHGAREFRDVASPKWVMPSVEAGASIASRSSDPMVEVTQCSGRAGGHEPAERVVLDAGSAGSSGVRLGA